MVAVAVAARQKAFDLKKTKRTTTTTTKNNKKQISKAKIKQPAQYGDKKLLISKNNKNNNKTKEH